MQEGLEAVAQGCRAEARPDASRSPWCWPTPRTGEILGEVGSADYFDASRSGWIDMTSTLRSPGSTLKPFIYGLAFEEGLVAQETLIEDRPADFAGYRPRNFDMSYQGDVSVRQALQLSLNVPAVRLLDAVGPARLTARFRQAGVDAGAAARRGAGPRHRPRRRRHHAARSRPALHRPRQWRQRQARCATAPSRQRPTPLADGMVLEPRRPGRSPTSCPASGRRKARPPRGIAYKTGTSYGYRDAWSVGFDGRYVLGVWVGRPDAGAVPGLSGYVSAAPILFEGFAKSGLAAVPLRAPAGRRLPPDARGSAGHAGALRARRGDGLHRRGSRTEPAPQIVFPPDGARVELGAASGDATPLVLKLQGGRAPFRWLANGKPLADVERRRTATWQPDGAGYSTLTVIDAAGRAASVNVFVE